MTPSRSINPYILSVNENISVGSEKTCISRLKDKYSVDNSGYTSELQQMLLSQNENATEVHSNFGCCVGVVGLINTGKDSVGVMNHMLSDKYVKKLIDQIVIDLQQNFEVSLLDFPELLIFGGHQLTNPIPHGEKTIQKTIEYLISLGYPSERIKNITLSELKRNQGSYVRLIMKTNSILKQEEGHVYYGNIKDNKEKKKKLTIIKN